VLEELPGNAGILLDETPEVPARELGAPQGSLGGHRGHARAFADQAELAEVIARAQPGNLAAIDGDGCFALGDDEEADPAHVPLPNGSRAGDERAFPEVAGQPLELSLAEAAEEWNLLEVVSQSRHPTILTSLSPWTKLTE
jgi:hypothetical protein